MEMTKAQDRDPQYGVRGYYTPLPQKILKKIAQKLHNFVHFCKLYWDDQLQCHEGTTRLYRHSILTYYFYYYMDR